MAENLKQSDFEEELFAEPKKEEPKEEPISEIIKCQYCQDVGVCSYCARGKEELSDRQNKSAPKKPERWAKLRPKK